MNGAKPGSTMAERTTRGGARGGRWLAMGVAWVLAWGALRADNSTVERGLVPAGCTHVVFVIETSAAMREANSGRLAPAVFQTVVALLAAQPEWRGVQMFDADGRRMLGARDEWQECGFELLLGIERVLGRYTPSTGLNPMPGIGDALGRMPWPKEVGARLQVYVIGDGLVSQGESVLCRLDELNPVDVSGRRRAVISAVQVAGARGNRTAGSGATGGDGVPGGAEANFREMMSEVARQHGGTFRALRRAER